MGAAGEAATPAAAVGAVETYLGREFEFDRWRVSLMRGVLPVPNGGEDLTPDPAAELVELISIVQRGEVSSEVSRVLCGDTMIVCVFECVSLKSVVWNVGVGE